MNPKSVLRIGKDAIPPLVTGDHNLDASFLMPEVKQPRFEESRLEPLYNGFQAEIGSTQLTAVKTSGHSPGHFCFKLDTPEGSMLYAGDAVFQCGSEAAGTDFERWKQDFETVPQNHNFDFIYLGHCNNNLLPNGMEFWRLASRMFLADFKLSHDGLYINPFGNPKLPESIPVEPPNSELIQAVCLQNWANKVLYDLGLFVAEKS
jgi:glyoxylase-like metal-dependent hydrolase (beta-lactamase superfamily II)